MENAKIFIVEDEYIEALNLKNILAGIGYEVIGHAARGKECIDQIVHDRPDLILMDIKLKGEMDGIETARVIRERFNLPIIFITALSDKSSLQRAKVTEPYGYIIKPFNERDLYTAIETSLYRFNVDRKLKESESKYRTLFEQSLDSIAITDVDGIITVANRSMLELFVYGHKAIIGLNIGTLFPERYEFDDLLERVKVKGYVKDYELKLKKSDGTLFDCRLTLSHLETGESQPLGFQCIMRDITDQKRIESINEKLLFDKSQRIKELNCLYSVSQISGSIETVLDEVFQELAVIIPQAFHYPDVISARIRYRDRDFVSSNFVETDDKIVSPLNAFEDMVGSVEIFFTKKASGGDEIFVREKKDLIKEISERLSVIIERKKTFEELISSREELRSLTAYLQELRENERTEIAREIHDVLGQSLTALKMDLTWLKKRLDPHQSQLMDKSEVMSQLIDSIIETVRRISSELRPGILDDLGLCAALEWHSDEFSGRTGIPCSVTCTVGDIDIEENRRITIYRIFQEALTNVIRHANASQVDVSLTNSNNLITLTVADNGVGIAENKIHSSTSLGLIGIRERAHSCGGTISITNREGGGACIKAEIPL